MGVRRADTTPAQAELNRRIAKLGGKEGPGSDRTELQALRILPLPSAAGHDGVAEYKLLLSATGVKRAEPTGSKTVQGGAELLKEAKLPHTFFPPASEALLVRTGTLNCHSGHCKLVFQP